MNMATALEDFSSWLSRTLEELNTDEGIFGSYIQSILDSDETSEEKFEALQGILAEIIENVRVVYGSNSNHFLFSFLGRRDHQDM